MDRDFMDVDGYVVSGAGNYDSGARIYDSGAGIYDSGAGIIDSGAGIYDSGGTGNYPSTSMESLSMDMNRHPSTSIDIHAKVRARRTFLFTREGETTKEGEATREGEIT